MSSPRTFQLKTKFQPAGDQPTAIKQLCASLENGDQHQLLLGVTGSGKTEVYLQLFEKVLEK